ncbi:hypothetical protein D3C73_1467660 [compost metagenome]
MISPARQVMPPSLYVYGYSPGSPAPIIPGRYGIASTSGIWHSAEVSRMAISIPLCMVSSTVATRYPVFSATASPGSR